MPGTITVGGASLGEVAGARIIGPYTIVGRTSTVAENLTLALASGDNTITVPTGASAVIVIPPAGVETALRIRTTANSGDGGLPLGQGPLTYPFPATAPASLIVNAAATVAGFTVVFI